LLEERRDLLRVIAAGAVIGGRQLEDVRSSGLQLLVPDGIGHREPFTGPGDRAHHAARLQHAIDFVQTPFGARQVKQDESRNRRVESVGRDR